MLLCSLLGKTVTLGRHGVGRLTAASNSITAASDSVNFCQFVHEMVRYIYIYTRMYTLTHIHINMYIYIPLVACGCKCAAVLADNKFYLNFS